MINWNEEMLLFPYYLFYVKKYDNDNYEIEFQKCYNEMTHRYRIDNPIALSWQVVNFDYVVKGKGNKSYKCANIFLQYNNMFNLTTEEGRLAFKTEILHIR